MKKELKNESELSNKSGVVCGWLTPRGKFYPCDTCKHRITAEELIEKYKIDCRGNINADYVLEKEGFIRITEDNVYSMQTSEYADQETFFKKITKKQLEFLLDNYYEFDQEQKEAINQIVKLADL